MTSLNAYYDGTAFVPLENREALIQEAQNYFQKDDRILLAILYGSYARGTVRKDSDIDIAIHAEKVLNATELMDLHSDLVKILGVEVDLIQLQNAKGLILKEIVKHGLRLKHHSSIFAYYNLQVIYFTEDYLPALRRMQDARIRKFIHGYESN